MGVDAWLGLGWIFDSDDERLSVLWPGSADYGDDVLFPLAIARTQCERFARALAEDEPAPDHYVAAQVLQARALVRAGITGEGDRTGLNEGVTVFPMDWTVKNLLRPRKGRPRIR